MFGSSGQSTVQDGRASGPARSAEGGYRLWLRRPVLVPAGAGLLALVLAVALAWLTWFGPARPQAAAVTRPTRVALAPAAPTLSTTAFVNRTGGYAVQVPAGMRAARSGKVTRIADRNRSISVTITPTTARKPAEINRAILRAMRTTYRRVDLSTSERLTVDRRPAVASYGRATTVRGLQLRFVLVAVRAKSRSFAISAFTAADSEPGHVLPLVRAITGGFQLGR